MSSSRKVLQAFLIDALRLSAQGVECVHQLEDQVSKNRVSPAQVRALYQLVHTLKGTAAMVGEAQTIVEPLHAIETRLSEKPIVDLARQAENWIEQAARTVENVHRTLMELQRRERFGLPEREALVRGLLVKTGMSGRMAKLWFPLSCLTRVLPPQEIGRGEALFMDGAWVPILGKASSAKGHERLGVGVRAQAGQAILLVEEVLGISSWSAAERDGASAGLDIFQGRRQDSPFRSSNLQFR